MCVLATGSSHLFVKAMEERGVETTTIPAGPHVNPILTWRLVEQMRQQAPDLVHTHLLHADLYGQLAARTVRIPAVSSMHGTHPLYLREPVRSAARMARHLARRTIAISRYTGEFAVGAGLAPRHRVRVVHYGIDATAWRMAPEERVEQRRALDLNPDDIAVGVASRLVPDKGHDVVIEAFASVVKQVPTARLMIAGSGPLRSKLEALALQALPLGQARFLGFQSDMRAFLGACDLVLFPSLPSFGEGFGLAALEAMAAGVPVLASDTGPLPEIVTDGKSGLVLPPGDSGIWADAITTLATDASLRARLGAQAGIRAEERFSVVEMADRTVGVYQEILSEDTRRYRNVGFTAVARSEVSATDPTVS